MLPPSLIGSKGKQKTNQSRFLNFGVVDFYPSIYEDLIVKSITFAKIHTDINDDAIETVFNARKTLLFSGSNVWVKQPVDTFDVALGSSYGVKVCELVGFYLLDQLGKVLGKKNVGLYRDDGLAVIVSGSGPAIELTRKKITKLFQQHSLQITSECNLKRTDFLDVYFDLENGTYCPYREPKDASLYINTISNQLLIIKKRLPQMIAHRLSELSCREEMLSKAAPKYKQALRISSFNENINFINHSTTYTSKNKKKRKRSRKIIWFNSLFSDSVTTNIVKELFSLHAKHFSPNNRLYKITNKISNSATVACLTWKESLPIITSVCSTSQHQKCKKNIIFKASVDIRNVKAVTYYGCCETDFKVRYYNHIQSFKNPFKRN